MSQSNTNTLKTLVAISDCEIIQIFFKQHRDRHRSIDRPRSLQSRRNRHVCVECFRRRGREDGDLVRLPILHFLPSSAPLLTSFPVSCHGLHGQGGGGVELSVRGINPTSTHKYPSMTHHFTNCSNFRLTFQLRIPPSV